MAPDNEPWYRTSVATMAAGLAGLALIAGLVVAVVQMSSRWDTSDTDIVVPPGTHLPEAPHIMATTTPSTSTSYTTSVKLSTTDIGLPIEAPSGTTTTTSSGSETPIPSVGIPTSTNAVAPTFPGSFTSRATHPPGPRPMPGRPSG